MHIIRSDGSPDLSLDPSLSIDQVVAIYKAMVRYFDALDGASDRVTVQRIGKILVLFRPRPDSVG